MGISDYQGHLSEYKGEGDKGNIFNYDQSLINDASLFNTEESMFSGSMFSEKPLFNTEETGEVKSLFNPVPEKNVSLFKSGEFTTGRSFTNNVSSKPVKKKKKKKVSQPVQGIYQPQVSYYQEGSY